MVNNGEYIRELEEENDTLRGQLDKAIGVLNDIVNMPRDAGLAVMCNAMRNKALVAISLLVNKQ